MTNKNVKTWKKPKIRLHRIGNLERTKPLTKTLVLTWTKKVGDVEPSWNWKQLAYAWAVFISSSSLTNLNDILLWRNKQSLTNKQKLENSFLWSAMRTLFLPIELSVMQETFYPFQGGCCCHWYLMIFIALNLTEKCNEMNIQWCRVWLYIQ